MVQINLKKHQKKTYLQALAEQLDRENEYLCISIGDFAKNYLESIEQSHGNQFLFLSDQIENAIGICVGLALEGFKLIVHAPATLLTRSAVSTLFYGISYQCLPITLVGLHAYWQMVSSLQNFEDLGFFSALPNFSVMEISEQSEIALFFKSLNESSLRPIYLRLPILDLPSYFPKDAELHFEQISVLRTGKDLLLISMGICSAEISRLYAEMDLYRLSWTHLHLHQLSPFPKKDLMDYFGDELKGVITVEAHLTKNGLGAELSKWISANELPKQIKHIRLGLQDQFMQGSSMGYLMRKYGFDALSIVSSAEILLKRKLNIDLNRCPKNLCLEDEQIFYK